MGNSSSSSGRSPHDETVDQGSLLPQGVYTGPQDWNQPIVSHLIVDRKLAPFYRPLEDYNDDWDDDQILAARKEFPEHSDSQAETQSQHEPTPPPKPAHHHKRAASVKEINKQLEASVYKGAVECPICFLVRAPCVSPVLHFMTSFGNVVLSSQYQSFSMLRPTYMYRMLCADQTS